MALKYRLDFSTNPVTSGTSRISYRLEISDTEFTGTVTNLKGGANPVEIEWKKDRDIYTPIIGSKMTINLLLEDSDTIDDFNSGSEFQYEARLRYKKSDDTYETVWSGFINPNDGEEHFGTYPLEVSYIATDGLGKIGNYKVRKPADRGQVSLLHYIVYALEQTGLGLDIYIDSSIQDTVGSGDGLTTATVDELAFIDEDTRQTYGDDGFNADELHQVLEGILAAFNCSVRQANNKWYIFNNSVHGSETSKTWDVYEYNASSSNKIDGTNYEAGTDVTNTIASLTYDLGGSSSDMHLKDESLYFLPRYPYGSIECKPANLRKVKAVSNPNFDNGTNGWTAHSSSADSTLTVGTQTGDRFEGYGNVISTTRNVFEADATSDIWFQTSSTGAKTVSKSHPIKVEFDYLADFPGTTDSLDMVYQIWVEFSTATSITRPTNNSTPDWRNWRAGSPVNTETVSVTQFWWDNDNEQWLSHGGATSAGARQVVKDFSSSEWTTKSIELPPLTDTFDFGSYSNVLPTSNPKVYVRFFYPSAFRRTNQRGRRSSAASGNSVVYIDNINIEGEYAGDPDPTFERVQDNYTTTLRYEPAVIGSDALDAQYYERLNLTSFRRKGTSVTGQSLESLVTSYKFRDYSRRLYAWEADVMNATNVPFSPVNLINIDSTLVGAGLNSDQLVIAQGGSWMVKDNVYRFGFYSPDQSSTVSSDFYNHDVNLIAKPPPIRDGLVTYILGYDFTSQDDNDNDIPDGIVTPRYWELFQGRPGQTQTKSITFYPKDGYEFDGDITIIDDDGDNKPAPTFVEDSVITNNGTSQTLELTVNIPDENDFEFIYLDSTLDLLSENNVNFDVSATTSSSGVSVYSVTEQNVIEGQQEFISVYVTPNSSSNEILLANSDIDVEAQDSDDNEIDNVIGTITELKYGTGVHYIIPVTPTTDLDEVVATVTATTTAIPAGDSETSTVTLTSTETNSDASVTNPPAITGVVGTRYSAIYEIEAEQGKYFDLDSITATTVLNYYVIFGSHTEYFLVVEGTIPATDQTINTTINIGALLDNPPLNSSVVTFNKGTDPSGVTVTKPQNQTGLWGVTEAVVYYLAPTNGAQQISTTPTATVTDSSSVTGTGIFTRSGTGWIYTLPFTYGSTDATVSVTFANATTANINTDTNTQLAVTTTTITASETGSNTANFNIADTSISVKGAEGSVVYCGPFQVEANSGYVLTGSVTVGGDSESFITPSGYSYIRSAISDYEHHVYVPVLLGSSDQTGTITFAVGTSDDDGDEVDHAFNGGTAPSNTTITLNSGANTLKIDPGDTTDFAITIEGNDDRDVSGITQSSTLPSWITSIGTTATKTRGNYETQKTFHFRATGQETAPSSHTFTWSGTATTIPEITNGNDGKSTYTKFVYQRSASALSTAPTGGSWDFGLDTFYTTVAQGAANALTSGWSGTIPTGTDDLYFAEYTFSIDGDTGVDDAGTWSTPALLGEKGDDGSNGEDGAPGADGESTFQGSLYQFAASSPTKPSGASYNFSTETFNAGTNGWSTSVPANDGNPLWQTTYHFATTTPNITVNATQANWSTPQKQSVSNGYIYRITVNSTALYNAKVSKSIFEFPFTDSDLGTTKTLSSGNTFTVDAADTAVQYTADTKPTEDTTNTDSSIGTVTIGDPNDDGECTVTIGGYTLPAAANLDNSGIYEAELVLLGPATDIANATSAAWVNGSTLTVPANGGLFYLPVQSNGRWFAAQSSSGTYSSVGKGWNDDPNGTVIVDFDPNTEGSTRTSTFVLYAGTSVAGTQLATITVTQDVKFSTESDDAMAIKLVTSVPVDGDDDYDANTLYLKY